MIFRCSKCQDRGFHNFLTHTFLDLLYSSRRRCRDRGRSTSPPPPSRRSFHRSCSLSHTNGPVFIISKHVQNACLVFILSLRCPARFLSSSLLEVAAVVGICCVNSCMPLCGLQFPFLYHVSSRMVWFRRFLLSSSSLSTVHASQQNRGKSLLMLALPQHMHFVTPYVSNARVMCTCWTSCSSTSSKLTCLNRCPLLSSSHFVTFLFLLSSSS